MECAVLQLNVDIVLYDNDNTTLVNTCHLSRCNVVTSVWTSGYLKTLLSVPSGC